MKNSIDQRFCPFVHGECVGTTCIFSTAQLEDEYEHDCLLVGAVELIDYFGIHICGYPNSGMNMVMEQLYKLAGGPCDETEVCG